DCSLYSAGGAQSDADYQAWISALAAGLGNSHAVVIVEPDGLANLPSDCSATTDPTGTLTAGRIADIKYAVNVLEARPNVAVYLDAGNVGWRAPGDMASRLLQAGVQDAQGFMLNVSNYWPTDENNEYGTWVAKCMWFATQGPSWGIGHPEYCASQYYSASAPNDGQPGDAVDFNDPSTWHWTEAWYDQNVGTPPLSQLSHFMVDTSRNGVGPWTPPAGTAYPDPQTWCNPPDRGIGLRPTASTGVPLVDAYLYVKTIGQSDGQCSRGEAGTVDPVYGSTDPAAGAWWPSMALTLAHNASPALTFNLG
ncbi:MAG TPA: glycoside hydrolase family 6 protein, partial [Micromonosporaceae bacterium]